MIAHVIEYAARPFRHFVRANEAVAIIEFALIMPVMLLLYLGSVELSQAINVDQRITNIAATVGDLAAREKNVIPASDLTDYFQASKAILSPYTTSGLVQTVSLVAVNSTGVTNVRWTVAVGGTATQIVGQPWTGTHPIPASMINISHSNWIIVSEASYPYQPAIFGMFLKSPTPLYHQAFYLPRFASIICYATTPCT
jgi:Flp pilus assembly protein TadG